MVTPSAPPPRGWPPDDPTCPAPSLQPHYRTFITTASRPAPVPRIGTLPLPVSAGRGSPSRNQGTPSVHFDWSSVSGRQVLLFRASACDELTPPIHRAPPGRPTGPSPGRHAAACLLPGSRICPGFDAVVESFDASAVVRTCSSSRRSPDPLLAGLFRSRFPPRLLTGMTLRWFGLPTCSASPEGLPPSLAQHGSCWRPSTSPSLPFQDAHPLSLLTCR